MALLTGVALASYAVNLFVLGPARPGRLRDVTALRGCDPAGARAVGK